MTRGAKASELQRAIIALSLEKFATTLRADFRFAPLNVFLLVALHLRAMNMVYEGLRQKGSMIIVPSSAVETMGLGALGGLTAFGKDIPPAPTTTEPEPE